MTKQERQSNEAKHEAKMQAKIKRRVRTLRRRRRTATMLQVVRFSVRAIRNVVRLAVVGVHHASDVCGIVGILAYRWATNTDRVKLARANGIRHALPILITGDVIDGYDRPATPPPLPTFRSAMSFRLGSVRKSIGCYHCRVV